MHSIAKFGILFGFILGISCQPGFAVRAQSVSNDSSSARSDSSSPGRNAHHPVYHVNYWVSVPIILVGGAGGLYWAGHPKSNLTDSEVNAATANPNNVPSFDRISLHQNISLVPQWDSYATIGQIVGAAMPFAILLDPDVRPDWLPVLTIGLEVNMVTLGIYTLTPLGPNFIDRYRPQVYYADASQYGLNRNDGFNKDSFYSGHVASVTASAMFLAKVYCDYHPDANEYVAYSLAAIPSLGMGVIRFMTLDHFPSDIAVGLAVGTACGVIIPQLHRINSDGLSLGMYSSPTSTGLTLDWNMASK